MLKHRVIPALLLSEGGLVKTKKFKDARYVGDPINAIRIFNEKEVDELMVLDILASKNRQEPDYSLIELFAGECFMPLCYGGGVKNISQAEKIFELGVEKISLQSGVMARGVLVSDIAKKFGSQSVVVSVDLKYDWLGKPKLYDSSLKKIAKKNWKDFVKEAVDRGAGELLINIVDKDGTKQGYDLAVIEEISSMVSIPVIALGGAGEIGDFKKAVNAGAAAVAAGAMFVLHGPHDAVLITYPSYVELENFLGGNHG